MENTVHEVSSAKKFHFSVSKLLGQEAAIVREAGLISFIFTTVMWKDAHVHCHTCIQAVKQKKIHRANQADKPFVSTC